MAIVKKPKRFSLNPFRPQTDGVRRVDLFTSKNERVYLTLWHYRNHKGCNFVRIRDHMEGNLWQLNFGYLELELYVEKR